MTSVAPTPAAGSPGWRVTALSTLGTALLWLIAPTWRMRFVGHDRFLALRSAGRPVIMAVWHGELLGFMWAFRGRGMVAMVSDSKDGELITRISQRVGYAHVRGSSSRGGARALLGVVRALEEGHEVIVTPDGPRGPAGVFQPGAIAAARRTGAPILPCRVVVQHAWRFESWDRFVLPKPFARVTVAVGEPVAVAPDSDESQAALCERLTRAMAVTADRAGDAD